MPVHRQRRRGPDGLFAILWQRPSHQCLPLRRPLRTNARAWTIRTSSALSPTSTGSSLDDAALHLQPPAGGWTIAQIFEHMRIADSSYVDGCLPKAIAKAQGKAKKPWKPSLFGGWLRRALANFQKPLPAPKIYRVAGVPRGDVVEAWLAGVRKLRALIESADRLDLNTRLSSPVSKLIRISLGDALAIPVVHSHRHLGQVERTRKALGR
jgi:hypothetical protein